MNTVIISQARMTSTRLPGKVLKEVLGKPLLWYQLTRLRQVKSADCIVVATTQNSTDDPVVDFCKSMEVQCFRGSEDDVLARFYKAASFIKADAVVRVTADCPLVDPEVIDTVIRYFKDNNFDYVSNTLERSYPRGLDVEVFSYKALAEAYYRAVLPAEREHVTPFLYCRTGEYKVGNVKSKEDNSKHRWTVDTIEDFELIKEMLEYLYPINPSFSLEDCIQAHRKHPHWAKINAHVEQKRT